MPMQRSSDHSMYTLGIRREDKNEWERRVPLTPEHVRMLKEKHGITTIIQPSPIRTFPDEEYQNAGAMVKEDLSPCPIVFAVKEIPKDFFQPNKTYVFFSHTIKGQPYNMPMLKKMMDLKCTLIDYEKIVDEQNRRLIFFGRFAGIAGMIETLWAFGKRLQEHQGIENPFTDIKHAYQYPDLTTLKNHVSNIGKTIETQTLPDEITPLVVGFAGYGNVSKGAQEILDLLPLVEITPDQLSTVHHNPQNTCVYKVVFKEKDMVKPVSSDQPFNLQEYYTHPELYQSQFEQYIPHLTILMNCIYWDERYPRLVTKEFLRKTAALNKNFKLQIIGDISVDINGAIEPTVKITTPDNPVYVYNPKTDEITDGYLGEGVVIMAVDNLPCELPADSSRSFGEALLPFIPSILNTDFSRPFEELDLPPEIKKAVILHQGKLTPEYEYIHKFL